MDSMFLDMIPDELSSLAVEGTHVPGTLTKASGVWIAKAGCFVLEEGTRSLKPRTDWTWFLVENGDVRLTWDGRETMLSGGDACYIPGGEQPCELTALGHCRCLWYTLEGEYCNLVVRNMGALLHQPIRMVALPSQMYLSEQIVQVVSRHNGTADATYQMQHLMYGMIASHWGQPVAMNGMLSHEIAKVVDTFRANQYKDNFSLAEMANISRMPMETFRKRFVAEVGMPPLSYVLHCKMERAKQLLRDGSVSVRDAGIAVGMADPYHFSKQFKHIVGMSPSAFMKQTTMPNATIHGVSGKRHRKRRTPKAEMLLAKGQADVQEEALDEVQEDVQTEE